MENLGTLLEGVKERTGQKLGATKGKHNPYSATTNILKNTSKRDWLLECCVEVRGEKKICFIGGKEEGGGKRTQRGEDGLIVSGPRL